MTAQIAGFVLFLCGVAAGFVAGADWQSRVWKRKYDIVKRQCYAWARLNRNLSNANCELSIRYNELRKD